MPPSLLTYITKPHFHGQQQSRDSRPPLVRQRSKSIPWDISRPFDKSADDLLADHVLLRNPVPSAPVAEPLAPAQPILDTSSWERTLERSIKSIVSIKASHVRSFDTETAGTVQPFEMFVTIKPWNVLSSNSYI